PDIEDTGGLPPLKGATVPEVRFRDITAKAGIRFDHTNGAFGKKMLPETMGSGVAFLDFDNDGHQDLLLIDSCSWPGSWGKGTRGQKLYRNKGNGTFENATGKMKLTVTLYGMGVAVGDYDNDGYPALFIPAVGGNRLFHNDKGQGFTDVTDKMRAGGPG